MRRRDFITLLGGAAAWPLAACAQQRERMRRIGVLLPAAPDDAEFQSWLGAFLQGLAQSGWITGRNIRIETRWTKFDAEETRKHAAELVALAPDVILATGTSTVGPLLRLTRTAPIVFPLAVDPVAAGLVESLARPGGNATGFMSFEIGISAKWLELLKENREEAREQQHRRYWANPKKSREQRGRYREANRERLREYHRRWHAANREKRRESKRRRYRASRSAARQPL
jgi:hypothetical protein